MMFACILVDFIVRQIAKWYAEKDEVLEVFQMKRSFDRVAMIRIGNNGKLIFSD